jgi:hypothetical protein
MRQAREIIQLKFSACVPEIHQPARLATRAASFRGLLQRGRAPRFERPAVQQIED